MKKSYFKKGFTLIETIVVLIVLGLVMPLIFAIIFGLIREQTKIYRLSTVKREGDNIINTVSTLIKNNARSIHTINPPTDANEVCKIVESFTSSNNRLIFKNNLGSWFRILWATDKISSYSSSTASSIDLNSNNVIVDNISIGCNRTSLYSPASVSLDFDICYKTASGNCTAINPEEKANLHYQTIIKLRSF